ncbi:MAG: hypothetical protein EZS28_030814, partial [Streblomastix strix]
MPSSTLTRYGFRNIRYGGGIYIDFDQYGQFIMSETCLFNNCQSRTGGGCYIYCYELRNIISISGQTEFNNCSSSYDGGGMYIDTFDQAGIDLQNIIFKDCSATNGGGLFIQTYVITNPITYQISISNSSFDQCEALNKGGGIYAYMITGAKLVIDGLCNFNQCTCSQPGNGGGIYLYQGTSSLTSITNSSFIDCKTISNSSDQRYGWGGAIFFETSVTAQNLNEQNFLMRDLVFIGCEAVNSIGNNLHIQSIDTSATGQAIKNGNLLTVIDQSNPPNIISNLYTSPSYAYDYMGINQYIETSNPGATDLDLHNPLFEQFFISYVPNPTYIDSINGKDIKFCGGQSSMCKTIKYAIDRNPTPFSEIPPSDINYSIIMTSNTASDTNIQITSSTLLNGNIIIQSEGYSSEVEDNYSKNSIQTSSFSTSLFTITEIGHLSLLGLHFDNLNPSSTNALISITSSDNAQQANITIIDCEFNQDSSSYLSSSLSHSIISINGGQMNGTAINSEIKQGCLFQIQDSKFIQCRGSSYGGAIYLNINNEGYATILNSSFDQCEAQYGGGIFVHVYTDGMLTIDEQCNFTQCKAIYEGGSVYCYIFGFNSQLTFEDGVKFEDCISAQGGGIYFSIDGGGQINIINQCLLAEGKSTQGSGGGIYSQLFGGSINIEDTTFDRCTCTQPGNGGGIALYQGYSSIISITNSLFINCETISNSSDQKY